MLGCSCSFGRRGGEGRGRSITGSFLIFFFSFSARQGDKYIPSNLAIEQALTSQQTFTYSKSTTETKKNVKCI